MAIRNVSSIRQKVGINWGKCINCDQSSSIASYTMPNGIDNSTDFTLTFSFLARTIDSTARRILEVGNGYSILLNSSSLQCQVGHNTTNAQANTKAGIIQPGIWYRVVITFDNDDNYPNMYVNAIQSTGSNVNKSGARLSPAGQTAYIGNRAALDRNFDGLLDKHGWWNRVWTDAEIQQDYFQNVQPSDSRIVLFDMDETSGNLIDSVAAIEATPSNLTQNVTSFTIPARSTVANRFSITSEIASLTFNGSSDLATSPIVPSTTGFCMALWYKKFVLSTEGRLVDWESAADRDGFNLRVNANSGLVAIIISNAAGTTVVQTATAAQMKTFRDWNFVCVTFAPNNSKLYVNGTLVATDTSCSMTSNVNAMTIGRRAYSAGNFFGGRIKNFIFHNTNTPWTATEVDNLYYRGILPSGAIKYSFNNTNLDQNGANGLTLSGTSYSTDVPGHMGVRSGV